MGMIKVNTDELRRLAGSLEKFEQQIAEFRIVTCNWFMALLADWQGHSRAKAEQEFQEWEQLVRRLEDQSTRLAHLLDHEATALETADDGGNMPMPPLPPLP